MTEQEAFLAVLPIADPVDRADRLHEICAGDDALKRRAELLLQAHADAERFLESPAAALATIDFRRIAEGPGSAIGPYKLLQQIGEGGFGVVYMAEQLEPVRRKVALKIIKPGMDTREVIARFESERQALALMDHPNIARVFDAGATASGRPYFVMELVKGLPITEFADKNRLTVEQRLPLFVDICRAVQHAHQKGVIHRDLKPSNVMVTLHDGRPVVKVIDFGVAKATSQQLTQRTLFTAYGQMIGTPAYMSPEQAEMSGLDIDTRSDIFSLGVLLYELLTGTTPLELERLRAAGFAEMQRLIREEEAPRPSTRFSTLGAQSTALASRRGTDVKRLGQFLRGDLDWIVMKSLEKDRDRRYDTPGAFAADVERFLNHDAIDARPPSTVYRLRKMVRRNAVAFTVASVVAAVSALGAATSTLFGIQATRQAARATAAERTAQENLAEAERTGRSLTAAREELRGTLYAAEMNLVQTYCEAGQYDRARLLLDRHGPKAGESDLRGWEWHYWQRHLVRGKLRSVEVPDLRRVASVRVQESELGAMSFTNGGERLAALVRPSAAGEHTKLVTFDAATARRLSEIVLRHDSGEEFPADEIPPVLSISNDGARFVHLRASSEQYQTFIRDGKTGATIASLEPFHGPPIPSPYYMQLAISPDGARVAQAHQNLPRFTRRGQVDTDSSPSPNGPDFDPTAEQFRRFALPNATLAIVDATTGKESFPPPSMGAGAVRLSWSADGQRLLTQQNPFRTLQNPARTLPGVGAGGLQRVSVDSQVESKLIDASTGAQLWKRTDEVLRGSPRTNHYSPVWSPDGRLIAVTIEKGQANSHDTLGSFIEVWNAETGETLATLAVPVQSSNLNPYVAFSPDGRMLAHGAEHDIHVWALAGLPEAPAQPVDLGAPTLSLPNPHGTVRALAFSRDGGEIRAVTGAAITAWDATLPVAKEVPRMRGRSGMVRFSSDASRIAINELPGYVSVCDASTGQVVSTLDRTGPGLVAGMAFSHDGRRLAVGLMGPHGPNEGFGSSQHHATIQLYDAEDGRALHTFDVGMNAFQNSGNICFLRDDRQLAIVVNAATERDGMAKLRVWDTQKQEELPAVELPWRTARLSGCTADGAAWVIAPQSGERKQLLTVNAKTGELAATHEFPGRVGLFEPRLNRVGVAQDGDLVIYDLFTGREQIRLQGFPPTGIPAFSPDGRRVALGSRLAGATRSQIDVWSLESGRRLLTLAGPPSLGHLAFTGDGPRLLARASGWPVDYPSQIWDATPLPETESP